MNNNCSVENGDKKMEGESQLDAGQIDQLKLAFDKLFDDYDCVFGKKNCQHQFVEYYGWLNKCIQVVDALQRTDKAIFGENIRLLEAYIALLPQCPFDLASKVKAIRLCDSFHAVTRSYPIDATLRKYWTPTLISTKQLTHTDMNIVYFKAYYESRTAREDLKVFLRELNQLYKNVYRNDDIGVVLESFDLLISSKYLYGDAGALSNWINNIFPILEGDNVDYNLKCHAIQILRKLVIGIKSAKEPIRKSLCKVVEKNIHKLVSRWKYNQSTVSNVHLKAIDTQPYVHSTIQSFITDILIQCYILNYGETKKYSIYLTELDPLLVMYSPTSQINETFNITLNLLMKLTENDNVENNFIECTVLLCEMAIKNKTISFVGYDQQLYRFIKKIVVDQINDASKVVIIGEFLRRIKSIDYINTVDPQTQATAGDDPGRKVSPLLYKCYISWKKYFLIFLCVCAQHFGPIGKQIFTKPLNNANDVVVIDELIKWLGCGIHEIIFYVIITLKYMVEYNPLLVVYTLEKCIENYLACMQSNCAPGFLYGLASMVSVASHSQYGIPHKILRKVFDVIMILAEKISNTHSHSQTTRMDCKRVIWLTISGICMLGSQIVKHFNSDIFNYFSITYDIRSFYGYVHLSDLDYCDITYSLIAMKNYAKYCPQLIDERISHKLGKYIRWALEVVRIYYFSLQNSDKTDKEKTITLFEHHFVSTDLVFSVFFDLLLEMRGILFDTGVDVYVNTAKICFNIIISNSILCSLIFEHSVSLKEIYYCPIHPWHRKISDNPIAPYQYFDRNYDQTKDDNNDHYVSSFPLIIKPLEKVETRMNHFLPISISTVNSAVLYVGKILCYLPDEELYMFTGVICENVTKDLTKYPSLKHYYDIQSNLILIFVIYLKECLKTKTITRDRDTLCIIYQAICVWKQQKSPTIQCLVSELVGLYFAATRDITLAAQTLVDDYRVAVAMEDEILVGGALLSIFNIHYHCKHAEIDNNHLESNIKLMLSYCKTCSVSWGVQHWSRYALYSLLPYVKSAASSSLTSLCLSNLSQTLMNTSFSYLHSVYDLSRCLTSVIECGLGLVDSISAGELEMIEMCIGMLKSADNDCITSEYFRVMSFYQLYCHSQQKNNSTEPNQMSNRISTSSVEKQSRSENGNMDFLESQKDAYKPKYIMLTCVAYLIQNHPTMYLNNAVELLKQLAQLYPEQVYLSKRSLEPVLAQNEHPMYVICEGMEGFLFGLLDITNEFETTNKAVQIAIKSLIHYTFKSQNFPLRPWFIILQKVISPTATSSTMSVRRTRSNERLFSNYKDSQEDVYQSRIVMPYWSTRKFALSLLHDIFVWSSREHFDIKSQEHSLQRKNEIFKHVSEIMKIALIATLSKNKDIELEGLKIIYEIIKIFGNVRDPILPNQLFLEQYILQINGSLKVAFKPKADPNSTLFACKIISQWISIKIKTLNNEGCDDMYELVGMALEQFQNQGSTLNHPIQGETAYTTRILAFIECFAHIYNVTTETQGNSVASSATTQSEVSLAHQKLLEKHSKFVGICCLTIVIDYCKIPTIDDAENADSLASTFFFKHIISGRFTSFIVNNLANILLLSVFWLENNFDNVLSLINEACLFDLSSTLNENQIWNYIFTMIYYVLVDICFNNDYINNDSLQIIVKALDHLLEVALIKYQLKNSTKSDLMLELLDVLYRLVLGSSNGDIYPSIISTVATIVRVTETDDNDPLMMSKTIQKVSKILVYMINNAVPIEVLPPTINKQINSVFLPSVSFSENTNRTLLSVSLIKMICKCCSLLCDRSYTIPMCVNSFIILYIHIFVKIVKTCLPSFKRTLDRELYGEMLCSANAGFTSNLHSYDNKLCQTFLVNLLASVKMVYHTGNLTLVLFKITFLLSSFQMIDVNCGSDLGISGAISNVVTYIVDLVNHSESHDQILEHITISAQQTSNQLDFYLMYGAIENEMSLFKNMIIENESIEDSYFYRFKTVLNLVGILSRRCHPKDQNRNGTIERTIGFAIPFLLHTLKSTRVSELVRNECLAVVQTLGKDFPALFKSYMAANAEKKLFLQKNLIENAKKLKQQSQSVQRHGTLSAQPAPKLTMDFSHFE